VLGRVLTSAREGRGPEHPAAGDLRRDPALHTPARVADPLMRRERERFRSPLQQC
jgi:hypothetical protein